MANGMQKASLVPALEIDDDVIAIKPDSNHDYLLTTAQVALGYGVSEEAIRSVKSRRTDELIEGKHWVVANSATQGGVQKVTHWTKKGVVRLGFFIDSDRAKKFRDLAEDFIFSESAPNPLAASAWALGRFALNTKNFQQVPMGYWSMYAESLPLLSTLAIAAGQPLPEGSLLDGSMGATFCKYLRGLGHEPDSFPDYMHFYPDGRTVECHAYPDALLPIFRKWLYEIYIPDKLPSYLLKKGISVQALPSGT
jgi:hypothetical protein